LANDTEVDIGLELDISQALEDIKTLQNEVKGVLANLQLSKSVIQQRITDQTRDLNNLLGTMKKGSDEYLAVLRRIEGVKDRVIASSSKGDTDRRLDEAAMQRLAAEQFTKTSKALEDKLTDQAVRTFSLALRNSAAAVDARLKNEIRKIQTMIQQNDADYQNILGNKNAFNTQRMFQIYGNPELLAARTNLNHFADQKTIRDGQDIDLQHARLNQEELRNIQLKSRFLDEEGITIEQQLREQAEIRRRYRAENFIDPFEKKAQDARLKAAKEAAEAADAEYNAARAKLNSYNKQRTIDRSQNIDRYGNPNAPTPDRDPFQTTFDRLNSNGGTDIAAVQARLMANYAVINALFSTLREGATFIVEFDKELHQIQAIAGATTAELGKFRDIIIDIADSPQPFSALELAQASTTLAQAGLSIKEVGESLKAVDLLATASGSDLAQSVDVITSALSIWNLRTDQTVEIANTMTAALNESKLSIDRIALALQYAGNTAAETGISYKELLAVVGTLSNAGVKSGSTLGTGVRQLIIDLTTPTKKLQEALKSVGLTEEDIDIKSKGLVGVLRTLHNAGFDTSKAFESLEVRAASAFAALDRNLDSISAMQTGFTNTNAAVEANAAQMESLANKWGRFTSTAGTSAYTAFSPALDVLKDIVDMATAVLSTLGQFPALLKIIGTGFAAISTSIAFNLAISNIVGMVKAVWNLVTATRAAEEAQIAFNLATMRNPYVAAATVILTLVTAVWAFHSSTSAAADAVEALKTKIHDLDAEIGTTQQTITSLSEVQEQLIAQKEQLDQDPILRKAKIAEIIDQFKELGREIDSSTSSVDKLSAAIERMSKVQRQTLVNQLELQKSLQESANREAERSLNATLGDKSVISKFSAAGLPLESKPGANPADLLIDAYKRVLPDTFDNLPAMLLNKTPLQGLEKNKGDLAALGTAINNAKKVLETSTNIDERGKAQQLVDTMTILADRLKEVIDKQSVTDKGAADLASINRNLGKANVLTSSSYLGLENKGLDIESLFTSRKNHLLGGSFKGTQQDRLTGLNAYAQQLDREIQALDAEAKSYGAETYSQFSTLIKPKLSALLSQLRDATDKNADKYFKTAEASLKTGSRTSDSQIQTLVKKAASANTQQEVELLEKKAMELADKDRKEIQLFYDQRIALERDPEKLEQLKKDRDDALTQANEAEQRFIESFNQRANAIRDDYLKALKSNVDDQISALNSKIKDNIDTLKKLKPGPAFEALKGKINEMINELTRLQNESNGLNLQINAPGLNTPYTAATPVTGTRAQRAAQVLAQLSAMGYSKGGAAGIIGNLIGESGINPNNPGDWNPTLGAFTSDGIAQWHGPRKDALFAWLQANGLDNNLENQVKYLDHDLTTNFPDLAAKLKSGTMTPDEAARAFAKTFEVFKGSNDPNNPKYAERAGYANGVANLPVAEQQQKTAEISSTLNQTSVDAIEKQASDLANTVVKSTTQQIETLVTQAKISQNPEAVQGLIKSVDDQYTKIIETRKKEFDTENAQGLMDDYTATVKKREEMLDGIRSDQNQKIAQLMDTYWKAVEDKTEKPIKDAQLALDTAQKPENAGKYTSDDIAKLQGNVNMAQQKAQAEQLAYANQMLLRTQTELTSATQAYGATSEQARFWTEQEATAKQKVVELTNQKNIADANTAKQAPSVSQAIQSANAQWAIQAGLMQRTQSGALQMVPLAQQVGNTWGQVLTGMADNLSTLFTNLASGTMSAKDAMKQFALSTIQMFIQMISKALAYQLIMSTIGKVSSGGSFLAGIFGVPGQALGGGVKGAATGELVHGSVGTRDSVLRKVQPGEFILRRSAVKQIGRDNLDTMNNLGNRRLSKGKRVDEMMADQQGGVVNVWIVSPDEKPTMGPNDVVAVISDNIQRKGAIKTLIKSVQMGAI